ncbi:MULTISPECIES: hypothetical protein [unclassified Caballeronia]|uniref:hypothetical protein n=1 Tax=unclassified Caballeronia TaxID=2646786 RepID=UPI002856F24F|nr:MULTISPECIES: hypothetical protein [unclassified Caballeronia]MDR5777565.1 hypothetical protein [Caballeronia sp. LZ002]MDR5852988.1 hypothetical protein [Caballeronia sp. LZ003]
MILYHRGVAMKPSATRMGSGFAATASFIEEDDHETSLGTLGIFASRDGALNFAIRCATAFIDGDDMPVPPFNITSR